MYESIKHLAVCNSSLAPGLNHINTKLDVKFDGSCLNQDKLKVTHGKFVNIYIVYEINYGQILRV